MFLTQKHILYQYSRLLSNSGNAHYMVEACSIAILPKHELIVLKEGKIVVLPEWPTKYT